jgi:hypothetical protein
MPSLRRVVLQLDRFHRPIELTVDQPAISVELVCELEPSAVPEQPLPLQQTMRISELDTRNLLRGLRLSGHIEELVVEGDLGLVDLRDLQVPRSVTALVLRGCRNLLSLRGIEMPTLSCSATIVVSHPDASFSLADVLPPDPRATGSWLANLERIEIHRDARDGTAAAADEIAKLRLLGYKVTHESTPAAVICVATCSEPLV